MATLIDTDIAIQLREGDRLIADRVTSLAELPKLSILSWVELEGGVYSRPELVAQRRAFVDLMLSRFQLLVFDAACAAIYRTIVERCGFSRPRTLDRMIAATAMVHDLTLATLNGADFRDIPGLQLEIWTP